MTGNGQVTWSKRITSIGYDSIISCNTKLLQVIIFNLSKLRLCKLMFKGNTMRLQNHSTEVSYYGNWERISRQVVTPALSHRKTTLLRGAILMLACIPRVDLPIVNGSIIGKICLKDVQH